MAGPMFKTGGGGSTRKRARSSIRKKIHNFRMVFFSQKSVGFELLSVCS